VGLKGHKWPFAEGTEWARRYSRHEVLNSPFLGVRTVRATQLRCCGNDAPSATGQLVETIEHWLARITLDKKSWTGAPLKSGDGKPPLSTLSPLSEPDNGVICPFVNSRRTEIRESETPCFRLAGAS